MTEHALFIICYILNTIICLIVLAGLLFMKPLRNIRNRKYRRACLILALAAGVVGTGHLLTVVTGESELTSLGLFAFPVTIISASQSLLFTFLLILLFREKYVTRRNILLHASPSIVLTVLYLLSLCFFDDPAVFTFRQWADELGNPTLFIRSLFCLTYIVQLFIYTYVFFRERAIYRASLDDLEAIPQKLELRWVTRAFLYALGIGVLAITLCFYLSTTYELAVTCIFSVFYLLVGGCYIHYQYTYATLWREVVRANLPHTPETKTEIEKETKIEENAGLDTLVDKLTEARVLDANQKLFDRAEELMTESLPFLNPGFNRQQLVSALYTNEHYLTRALRQHTRKSIQDYITYHRYNYAHTQLLIVDDPRSIEQIALDSGFSSVRTFNRCFKKLNGDMTPSEFRKMHK